MRRLAEGGRRMLRREHELYSGGHSDVKTFDSRHKVQAYYSLRCAPQILGPVYETLQASRRILEEELNSACDNPIVDPERRNVFHGGNFHGDYISLEQDKVKIAMTRVAMTAERQLNYLFHDRINNILPPFLNLGTLGLNYGMQACSLRPRRPRPSARRSRCPTTCTAYRTTTTTRISSAWGPIRRCCAGR